MGTIANGGRLMKPALIEKVVSSEGLVVSTAPSQTPTQVILRGVETGNGDSLSVYGEISTVKEGIWLLENEQWWDDGD